eukprot:TRINITY_DN60141_c0_g1_i1.p1 TRINITY_DN60141_c0_g1~~TRINITY_DN60141_c0_g1_i1.p1  ORF type:complete len:425 (-),score=60.35 TRINITY_DN60141_c0_g1_i1:52-1326(-)
MVTCDNISSAQSGCLVPEEDAEWGLVDSMRVPTTLSRFKASLFSSTDQTNAKSFDLSLRHVPMRVQTACDPAIYAFGRSLGVDPAEDDDALWDFGHTGLQLWPSAQILGDFLLTQQGAAYVRNRLVLELGCGVGILGPIAMLAGAKRVICTDADPLALSLCQHNAHMNRGALANAKKVLEGSPSGSPAQEDNIIVQQLDWRDEDGLAKLLRDSHVEVALCADVVYEEAIGSNLLRALYQLTDVYPRCEVLVAVKYRRDFDIGEVPTAKELQDEEQHLRSVVARWLGTVCGAGVAAEKEMQRLRSTNDSPGAGKEGASQREKSRSPRREKASNSPFDGSKHGGTGSPAFEAECLSVWRGSPRIKKEDAAGTDTVEKAGLVEILSASGAFQSCATWEGSDADSEGEARFEVWRLRRATIASSVDVG